MTKWSIYQFGK